MNEKMAVTTIMDDTLWQDKMLKLQRSFAFLENCNVIDIAFVDGQTWEVYVAITTEQRRQGLSDVAQLDLSGMLFCYERPSFLPFHMKNMQMDIDIAWYDQSGHLLQLKQAYGDFKEPMYCHSTFSYVLEAPIGTIPHTDLAVSHG